MPAPLCIASRLLSSSRSSCSSRLKSNITHREAMRTEPASREQNCSRGYNSKGLNLQLGSTGSNKATLNHGRYLPSLLSDCMAPEQWAVQLYNPRTVKIIQIPGKLKI